ncbi:MAG: insulinase family protein, partial [Planctomycetota bacterium]
MRTTALAARRRSRMPRRLAALAWILAALCATLAPARAEPAATSSFAKALIERVHEIRLDNGLRIVVLPRTEVPVFSAVTMVNVGAVDEHVGITGVAHIFEHMAFKGSRTLGTRDFEAEQR